MVSFNFLLESLHDKSTTQIPYLKNFLNIFIGEKKKKSHLISWLYFFSILYEKINNNRYLFYSILLYYSTLQLL